MAKQDTRKTMVKKPTILKKRKAHRNIPSGVAYITATFSNTIVSVADLAGNVIAWGSSGKSGFTGSRKSNPFAANVAGEDAAKQAIAVSGMKDIEVVIRGPGPGRESAVKGLRGGGLDITSIKDDTPIAHGGCRPPKRRRV